MTTGEKIQYYRKKLGLSQEELGQMLLVSRQTVSLWENGQTAPTIDNLMRLREIFGISVDELLGCESEKEEESPEADPDAPVPSESYSISFYKNELDKIYKYILKLSFKKPIVSTIILAVMLAVYISIDVSDVLVGILAGVLVIFAVSVLKQFLSHRKVWRESTERVLQSRYEYQVYSDYFTVDIIRNNELVRSERISFSDIKKAHDLEDEKYVVLNINNQLYILRKNVLAPNSAFYMALYNSSKLPDKKSAKKLNTAANVFAVVSVAVIVLLSAVQFENFVLENPWVYLLGLPISFTCTTLGFILKSKGFKYGKNIAVGIIASVILCIGFSINYSLSDIDGFDFDPVAYFTEATGISLPEDVADRYTVDFDEDTQPSDTGYIYSTTRVVFEEYSVYSFEYSLEYDTRWLDAFPEELNEWLLPLDFDEGHKSADVMMLYNTHEDKYNTVPKQNMFNSFMAVFYHSDENVLEIFEYELSNNEENSTEESELTELEQAFYNKIKPEILKWNEKDIYAISFLVYSNEEYRYRGFENVTEWAISYNTEADCSGAGQFDEERWNFAFWRHNMTYVIAPNSPDKLIDMLFDWYEEQGITNIGEENYDNEYDENGNYIGKGPVGYYELLQMAANVAKKLHEDGVIKEQFGKDIPIIVHDLEYPWYVYEATQNANPDGQANTFLTAMEKLGMI